MSAFLEQIRYREFWLTVEALAPADLPPYLGSTLRGALGHLLRSGLCETGNCAHECERPAQCRYFSLFEQSRSATGQNVPKPLVLLPPSMPDLEQIALGGPIYLPFRTGRPKNAAVPTLWDESRTQIHPPTAIRFGLRLFGGISAAAPAIVEAISRHGLSLAGAAFQLQCAYDASGELLFDRRFPSIPPQMPSLRQLPCDPLGARRVRIVFLTPAVFKIDRAPSFDPVTFASRFFEHSMARAAQIHNAFVAGPRVPWLDPPNVPARICGYRLFRYELARRSYRQDKWLDFDGLVGYVDLEGELNFGLPYARAAEIVHFGQKATFGLGKIRLFILE